MKLILAVLVPLLDRVEDVPRLVCTIVFLLVLESDAQALVHRRSSITLLIIIASQIASCSSGSRALPFVEVFEIYVYSFFSVRVELIHLLLVRVVGEERFLI